MTNQKMHNILFLVAGMTPQIITETVWALACDKNNPNPWLPEEIVVLSTTEGLNQIKGRLFEQGVFAEFKHDYPQLKNIKFDEQSLLTIEHNGKPLDDIKTPTDNEIMANILCELIAKFTKQDNISLHVSIAGGRKTMGYYAGYALSIYGRPQDALSHVLVESKFERGIDFFYPTTTEKFVYNSDKEVIGNAQDAKVWLAQIPFVRMRGMLDEANIVSNKSFSEVVNLIEQSMQPISIKIVNNDERKVYVGNRFCKLSPRAFSMYLLVAKMRLNNEHLIYPSKEIEGDNIQENAQIIFNEIYSKHKNAKAPKTVFVDCKYMDGALADMKKKFNKEFGKNITDKIMIQKDNNHKGYTILLSPEQITLS